MTNLNLKFNLRAPGHFLITFFTLLISLSTVAAQNQPNSVCGALLFHAPNPSKTTYYRYTDASWTLVQKLEIQISAEDRNHFEARWKAIEDRAHRFNWFNILDDLQARSTSMFKQFNLMRMKPSNSIAADSSLIPNWEAAEAKVRSWALNGSEITLERLRQINTKVGFTFSDSTKRPGLFRHRAGIDDFTDAEFGAFSAIDVKKGMEELLNWYKQAKPNLHPLELATLFYQRLTTIHPFFDGNGRTARLAMDWILMMNGYPPATFTVGDVSVNRSWDADRDYYIEHSLSIVTDAVENSLNHLTRGQLRRVN